MAASFPVTFPSALAITGTQTLQDVGHTDNLHIKDRDEIIAAQRKLGLGSSVASGTVALLGTGGTQSAWGQITDAYIAGTAAIAVSKLAALTSGLVRSNGTVISGGATITNADVDAAGAISLSKLAATTSGLVRSDGTVIAGGATVSSSDIVNDTIVNADINSAAAIALSKLAAGGSNGDVVTQVAGVLALAAPSSSSSFTLLSSQTLAAPAASVTFSSISGAYKHLLLLSNTRTTVGNASFASMAYNFNGDTGANYANQLLAGAQATGQTSLAIGGVVGSTSYANMFILNRLWIHDYAQASYVKVCDSVVFGFSGSGPTTGNMNIYGGLWYATPAAIATILLTPSSGSFAIGSKFWLYGVN